MHARGPAVAGIALAIALLGHACGGGSSPGSPTPSPQPAPTPPPATTERWTVSGRVITLGDGRPIGGAQVTSEVGPSTQTDAGGQFTIGSDRNPPVNPHGFTIDASGFLTRTAYVRRQDGRRDGIVFDMIPLAAPFSLDFYRALVRNTYEAPSDLEPLRRWMTNPRFYIRSVDAEGRPIEPEVLDLILATIPDTVREFTGGQIAAGQVEIGTNERPLTTGWINVNILRDPASDVCGRAKVGVDPGEITLYYDRCGCGSQKIRARTIAHEMGHALGFWHIQGPDAVMTSSASGCPSARPSDQERFHGAIAYRRPAGNRDPDADPQSRAVEQLRPIGVDGPVISCRLR